METNDDFWAQEQELLSQGLNGGRVYMGYETMSLIDFLLHCMSVELDTPIHHKDDVDDDNFAYLDGVATDRQTQTGYMGFFCFKNE